MYGNYIGDGQKRVFVFVLGFFLFLGTRTWTWSWIASHWYAYVGFARAHTHHPRFGDPWPGTCSVSCYVRKVNARRLAGMGEWMDGHGRWGTHNTMLVPNYDTINVLMSWGALIPISEVSGIGLSRVGVPAMVIHRHD